MFRSRFIEIQADSRCSGIPAGGGDLCWSFSVALHSLAAAAAVMPVWLGLPAATSWLCLGIGPSFFCPIVAHCLEMLFASSAGRILLMNFKL